MTQAAAAFWDSLHEQARFRPAYPNEHVVRFLAGQTAAGSPEGRRALDIGVGGGRHAILLAAFGYEVDGVDISAEGLRHARAVMARNGAAARLQEAPMDALPFPDESFDVAISFGVFYYGTADAGRVAIGELHRVLKPGAHAFVVMRTTRDFRYGKGDDLGGDAFRLLIDDTNENGTVQHFLSAEGVQAAFAGYSQLGFELTETTFADRTGCDSDWLITVRK
jgi:SAM-dependent methyltransferase